MDPARHGTGLGSAAGEERGFGGSTRPPPPRLQRNPLQVHARGAGARCRPSWARPRVPSSQGSRGPKDSLNPCGRGTGNLRKRSSLAWGHRPAPPRLCRENSRALAQLFSSDASCPVPVPPASALRATKPESRRPPLPRPTDLGKARTRGLPSLPGTERRKSAVRTQPRPAGSAASALAGEGAQSSPPRPHAL